MKVDTQFMCLILAVICAGVGVILQHIRFASAALFFIALAFLFSGGTR